MIALIAVSDLWLLRVCRKNGWHEAEEK